MKTKPALYFAFFLLLGSAFNANAAGADSVTIHNLGHASLMFEFDGKVIHVDPVAAEANYAALPKADIIFITHGHGDHYNIQAINLINQSGTIMVLTQEVKNLNNYSGDTRVMNNGDSLNLYGIAIEAVPAYNIVHKNGSGQHYHPVGVGNGYILTMNETRIYVAGDTENIPEMDSMDVNIAFIPMNVPYTMTPEMAADAAKRLKPRILYIYHYGSSNTNTLRTLLQDEEMEIRIGESTFTESTKAETTGSVLPQLNNEIFKIYPNPSNGLITMGQPLGDASLSVFDINGRVLFSNDELKFENNQLDLQSLNNGNYLMEVKPVNASAVRQLFAIVK